MRIAVIGTGYVGLVAGACFADIGNTVYCVDQDQAKIDALKQGKIPIYEPGLEDLVKRGYHEKRIHFTTSTPEAVAACEVIFLAVGTPAQDNGEPNLVYLRAAAEQVARAMNGYKLIINKSTVPIGSHQVVTNWMKPLTQHKFDVASNPEFLKEGSAVDDFLKPDRVVIGTDSQEVYKRLADLYAPFVRQGNPVLWMDPVSAEITKYACNSFLATRISFMNELSHLCEKTGGDIEKIRKGMTTDVRIGKHFLYAGVGYGGSCFPKDIQALLATARRHNVELGIVDSAEKANEKQKSFLFSKMSSFFNQQLSKKIIAIWGLAFKPNTDDMREAPSLVLISALIKAGASVRVFDPVATETAKTALSAMGVSQKSIHYCSSVYEAIEGADALTIVTEWNEFRNPDFDRIKKTLKNPVLFDGRNIFDPAEMKKQGFRYFGVGRGETV